MGIQEHEPYLTCNNNDVLSLGHNQEEKNDKSGRKPTDYIEIIKKLTRHNTYKYTTSKSTVAGRS